MSEVEELRKILNDHEKRICKLESLLKMADKEAKHAKLSKASIPQMLRGLKEEGFFDQPRFLNDVKKRLAQDGFIYSSTSLSKPLQNAVKDRTLGRIDQDGQWAYIKR